MANNEKYKVLEVRFNDQLSNSELELINNINKEFSKKDFYLAVERDKIIIYLNQLDLEKFGSMIAKYNLDPTSVFHKAYEQISSIGSYGIKGGKRLFVGYNKERKVANRKGKEKERKKFFYAKGHNFSKQNNEFPSQYLNKIICADSEEFLTQLPDNCVDLIFTSPPYNFGLDYENHDDSNHWENYFTKLFNIFKECIRVTKYSGRILVNVQPLFSDYIPSHHMISNFFLQNKMLWKGEIIWEKNNYNCKYTAWGSWKSPASPYLKYTWEFIEVFCKGDLVKKGDNNKIDISADEFKQWVVAKWSIAPERKMKEFGHPAMFPEQLVERVLKLFSYKDDIILDPFNGVGTTTTVACKLGRNYIGIDISEEYCEKAKQRLKNTYKNYTIFDYAGTE
ncbi:MAG: DNA-methyltransferase [Thermacetogeniaceae bacterium]|nr:site-specific DNA-methyltransferase [Thermoanaerobacterales bacterium]NLN20694.1 site-specific DNA-methyltransferase [Syntrophomonadaceae bacterium]HAF17228.1 DNA methylase [Peptococcaceae bacterium]